MAEQHALLVAVSGYPTLPKHRQLFGPKHDAVAMHDFLLERQGVARDRIIMLADQVKNANDLPTRQRILEALAAIAGQVQQGDKVWLYFAGHGSQQPQPPNPRTREADGLDEIFLPQDVGHWDGEIGSVINAIIDDELDDALEAIRARGAGVVAIFDTCHAADSVRGGASGERMRGLPGKDLGIPKIGTAVIKPGDMRKSPVRDMPHGSTSAPASIKTTSIAQNKKGTLTALYASASHESTPEMSLPTWSPVSKPRGLFTHTLLDVWTKHPQASPAELVSAIKLQYKKLGRTAPTPASEVALR